ncbi:MAG: hypothetical protein A2X46_12890 [Lentisphaerae bacterium GWF2_57_35]|nr:MAG: hypothetical protein A2X46_12890 [Lentisphaerae bacterium GWF2_57_35]
MGRGWLDFLPPCFHLNLFFHLLLPVKSSGLDRFRIADLAGLKAIGVKAIGVKRTSGSKGHRGQRTSGSGIDNRFC